MIVTLVHVPFCWGAISDHVVQWIKLIKNQSRISELLRTKLRKTTSRASLSLHSTKIDLEPRPTIKIHSYLKRTVLRFA